MHFWDGQTFIWWNHFVPNTLRQIRDRSTAGHIEWQRQLMEGEMRVWSTRSVTARLTDRLRDAPASLSVFSDRDAVAALALSTAQTAVGLYRYRQGRPGEEHEAADGCCPSTPIGITQRRGFVSEPLRDVTHPQSQCLKTNGLIHFSCHQYSFILQSLWCSFNDFFCSFGDTFDCQSTQLPILGLVFRDPPNFFFFFFFFSLFSFSRVHIQPTFDHESRLCTLRIAKLRVAKSHFNLLICSEYFHILYQDLLAPPGPEHPGLYVFSFSFNLLNQLCCWDFMYWM